MCEQILSLHCDDYRNRFIFEPALNIILKDDTYKRTI